MKISYSVVFYNQSEEQIRRLVKNIIETVPPEVQDYKIYLINNSIYNFNIKHYLDVISHQDNNIIVFFPLKNKGFGAGHNYAISQINSDFHFVVNPDIKIPDSDQISQLIHIMQSTNATVISPKILFPNGHLQALIKKEPTVFDMMIRFLGPRLFVQRQRRYANLDIGYDKKIESVNMAGSFLIIRTSILKKINGFDERFFLYMEDADLCRGLSKFGETMYTPDAYVYHDWQRENRKSLKGILIMILSMIKYFNKWGWKWY
ncbi:glycosyltransferase [Oenococcus oeni]|uniref:glycosyltransferase n=1 Tax=Oenococcus oeni TaxID=1247 RepID=UPI0010B2FE64|nr:glycosyltransferase [Oenococcus oeni]SYW19991.1 Glycosyltransferase WelF [Oenococcus oeni]